MIIQLSESVELYAETVEDLIETKKVWEQNDLERAKVIAELKKTKKIARENAEVVNLISGLEASMTPVEHVQAVEQAINEANSEATSGDSNESQA